MSDVRPLTGITFALWDWWHSIAPLWDECTQPKTEHVFDTDLHPVHTAWCVRPQVYGYRAVSCIHETGGTQLYYFTGLPFSSAEGPKYQQSASIKLRPLCRQILWTPHHHRYTLLKMYRNVLLKKKIHTLCDHLLNWRTTFSSSKLVLWSPFFSFQKLCPLPCRIGSPFWENW